MAFSMATSLSERLPHPLLAARRAAFASSCPLSGSSMMSSLPAHQQTSSLHPCDLNQLTEHFACGMPGTSQAFMRCCCNMSPLQATAVRTAALRLQCLPRSAAKVHICDLLIILSRASKGAHSRCHPRLTSGQRRGGCGRRTSASAVPTSWDLVCSVEPAARKTAQ